MNRDLTLMQTKNNFVSTDKSSSAFWVSSFDAHRYGVFIYVVAACNLVVPAVFATGETAGRLLSDGIYRSEFALYLGAPEIIQGLLISISIIIFSLISILIIGFSLIYGNPKGIRRCRYTQNQI